VAQTRVKKGLGLKEKGLLGLKVKGYICELKNALNCEKQTNNVALICINCQRGSTEAPNEGTFGM
jgi:hypothetical protein